MSGYRPVQRLPQHVVGLSKFFQLSFFVFQLNFKRIDFFLQFLTFFPFTESLIALLNSNKHIQRSSIKNSAPFNA
jgi:hypothetical protein